MAYSRRGGEKTSISICRKGGQNADDLNPLCPLSLLADTHPVHTYLTLPFSLSRDARAEFPASPDVELAMAVAQIGTPGTLPFNPTLSELTVVRRAAPSHPRHPEGPLGKPPHRPNRPRVRSSSPSSWGRRRRWAVDRDLIERSSAPRTDSAWCASDRRDPPIGRLTIFPPVAPARFGPACARRPRSARSGPSYFF
jgi:hypothetical protein